MLARVAQNVYWMARYLERTENIARLVNVHTNLLLDLPKKTPLGWKPLLAIAGSEELFYENHSKADEGSVVRFLIEDRENPGSLLRSLDAARENLRISRDLIPRDVWEQVNDLQMQVKNEVARGVPKKHRYEFLCNIIYGVQQVIGLFYGAMSRGLAYDFSRMGRYLERADMTTRIIDVRSADLLKRRTAEELKLDPYESIQWMSVLKSLTAYQMYRQYSGTVRVRGADVLKFLLQDGHFPRALYYCLEQVDHCIIGLPNNHAPLKSLAALQRRIKQADMAALADTGLHEFIDKLQIGMGDVHNGIDQAYFGGQV